MRVVAVVGNPNRGGRTTTVAHRVASRVASVDSGAVEVVELADIAEHLFAAASPTVDDVMSQVAAADVAIFASPTYKAGITGLLKAFFDRYGSDGLAGLVAVPVMLGGRSQHALAVETQLRPILVELAATTPTRGLYVVDTELDRFDAILDAWWNLAERPLRALLGSRPLT